MSASNQSLITGGACKLKLPVRVFGASLGPDQCSVLCGLGVHRLISRRTLYSFCIGMVTAMFGRDHTLEHHGVVKVSPISLCQVLS